MKPSKVVCPEELCLETESVHQTLFNLNAEFRRFQEVVVKDLNDIKADLDVIRSA
ncbi:unnamed protein product, partial [Allacma fusca]